MKKTSVIFGVLAVGAFAQQARAAEVADSTAPTCTFNMNAPVNASSEGKDLPPPPPLSEAELTSVLEKLENRKKELKQEFKEPNDEKELNSIALSYVQQALSFYSTRESNIAACESALKRWKLVNRIKTLDALNKKVALDAEKDVTSTKLEAAKSAHLKLREIGPKVTAYRKLSLGKSAIVPEQQRSPVQIAEVSAGSAPDTGRAGSGTGNGKDDDKKPDCDKMISAPAANLNIGTCRGKAIFRSVRKFAGGDVAFPSSVLSPRGLAANLSGSSSDGSISIAYTDSFKFRRYADPDQDPPKEGKPVQLPWEFGYSLGIKGKDGELFSRGDTDDTIKDGITSGTTVSAGLFFNVFKGETLKTWEVRANKLKEAALTACRKEQSGGASKAPSTCTDESLTNWVYALKDDGTLLHPELAKQADDLYFGSADDKPVWGGGINSSVSRNSFEFLDPEVFVDMPDTKPTPDRGWSYGLAAFAYWRLTPKESKWDVSLIGSLARNSDFGYLAGTNEALFCPAATAGEPFVTSPCPSYYKEAPQRIVSWTPAVEVRFLTPRVGFMPRLGISPRLSYKDIEGSDADRWTLALPVLAFVDKEKGLGVGFEYARSWGGEKPNDEGVIEDLDTEDKLKIVVSKTFSLTGL